MQAQPGEEIEGEKDESVQPIETVIQNMLEMHYNQDEEEKNKHSYQ
jgi:hypothetical protein